MPPPSVDIGIPQRLCHLPLVMDVLRRTGLIEIIDRSFQDDRRSKVSTSECVSVILCAVFLGHHDLWRMSDRLGPYDMATLMRDSGFRVEEFPEERLAKALDDLYGVGLDKLMTALALQSVEQFRIGTDFLHFDTTSLSFFGAHEREDFGSMSDGVTPPPPVVTHGYSKDRRPDLKQILFGSLVSSDGGVPLFGKALDGNGSDTAAAAEFFGRVRRLVRDPREVCCVADSKGWSGRVLDVVQSERLRLLSRLPRSHRLHRDLMAKPWDGARRIERPARSARQEPDSYEIIGFDVEETFVIERAPAGDRPARRETLTVPARAVRIFSSALLRQKLGTLARTREREARAAAVQIRDWQARAYACAEDAKRAADRHCAESDFVTLDITARIVAVDGPFTRGRGRPRKHPEPDLAASHYRITYTATPVDEAISRERLRDHASFVLIRTRTSGWTIDDAELIDRYKGQYHNEHGFAWLKGGSGAAQGINPIFLATPTRIASLCFLYLVGLIVWTIIQRTVRNNLAKMGKGLPYRRNKPSNRITTRFLFELFPRVQTVPFSVDAGPVQKKLVGFDEVIRLACMALGTSPANFEPVLENRP